MSWKLCVAAVACLFAACHASIAPTASAPPTPEKIAELWHEPEPNRDLFWGIGGQRLAPDPSVTYKVLETKRAGFSMGVTIEGADKRKGGAKLPPGGPTEVVASRLLWGVGFHQPPLYYVGKWMAEGAREPNPQLPARFRESKPDLHGLDAGDTWSYYHGPFVGTRELNGLLVLMVMLGN